MDIISKNRKKVLCIDDDRTLQLIVKQVLRSSFGEDALELFQSESGEDGMEKVVALNPDIILCDVNMPGIDGFEVCRRVRALRVHSAIVLMSSYDAESDYATRASELGADAYLSKPLKKGELIFVVNFVLRVAHLNDAVFEKNKQLEQSLIHLKEFHHKLANLNSELVADKRRMGVNLREMTVLNSELEGKNSQISAMVDEMASRFDSTVSLLANIIELHQAGHRGHAERVAESSGFIAKKMGLQEHQVRTIQTAARLHELGIVALPSEEKKEEAYDEEKSRKRTNHPLVGEMLLKGLPGFELVADIIRHLHENVDGSGVPDALYGDRIPIGSRIISVASFYDHFKVSHSGMEPTKILAEMEDNAGIIFDEQVLAFMSEFVHSRDDSKEANTMDCAVFALVEGMELAADIFSESGINLVKRGTVLNKDLLNKILKFHNVDPIAGSIKIKQPA